MSGTDPLRELLEIMVRLRDPRTGCSWDRAQDFRSIAPYTLEEAYEVADAIEHDDPASLRDELGDLLFQVVFHARMAEERGWFAFDDVAGAIRDKLVRRHPHVFQPGHPREPQPGDWERHKAEERSERARAGKTQQTGALAGVPLALPALSRAAKLGRRAARVGFDWPDASGVRDKLTEELGEVDAALAESAGTTATAASARVVDEVGDVLFALANWARHLGVDPETALRGASSKFERRFARMEHIAAARGESLADLSSERLDALWNQAKRDTTPVTD